LSYRVLFGVNCLRSYCPEGVTVGEGVEYPTSISPHYSVDWASSSSSSSSASFIFKIRDMSKSIQIKAGTTRQVTALTVALGIHINTSIKH